jgi:hypothetical protein
MSKPIFDALGSSSCKISSRFGPSSVVNTLTPVALPPGRFRLLTSPNLTGSSPTINASGADVATAFAANAVTLPPAAAITPTRRETSSDAIFGS